jgi:hypothetical protein
MKRDAFAWGYLACFLATELVYTALSPHGRAALVAWASTNVANLEHEPVGPMMLSAFVAPDHGLTWPVLIALALPGAGRALGSGRAALVCAAGHVIGTLVSEGIIAYRVAIGALPQTDRYLTDVGPSYVVVAAIVVAVMCGTWPFRVAALVDFALLAFPGRIFAGLPQLDVSAVGHLTAALTAAAAVGLIIARKRSGHHVADGDADQVGDPGGEDPQYQLP